MPLEYSISLDDWISRFPLEAHRDAVRDIRYLSGPFDLAILEQIWRENRQSVGADTDVFVFARSEPEFPHVTKIGGIPYRPDDKPWPICMVDMGNVYVFIHQDGSCSSSFDCY